MNQQVFATIRCDGRRAVLECVDNHLLVIKGDQTYTSFVVQVLFHDKTGRGGGALIRGEALF